MEPAGGIDVCVDAWGSGSGNIR